jgi:hypothetical protein
MSDLVTGVIKHKDVRRIWQAVRKTARKRDNNTANVNSGN